MRTTLPTLIRIIPPTYLARLWFWTNEIHNCKQPPQLIIIMHQNYLCHDVVHTYIPGTSYIRVDVVTGEGIWYGSLVSKNTKSHCVALRYSLKCSHYIREHKGTHSASDIEWHRLQQYQLVYVSSTLHMDACHGVVGMASLCAIIEQYSGITAQVHHE